MNKIKMKRAKQVYDNALMSYKYFDVTLDNPNMEYPALLFIQSPDGGPNDMYAFFSGKNIAMLSYECY